MNNMNVYTKLILLIMVQQTLEQIQFRSLNMTLSYRLK